MDARRVECSTIQEGMETFYLSRSPCWCLGCVGDHLVEVVVSIYLNFSHGYTRLRRPGYVDQAVAHRLVLCALALATSAPRYRCDPPRLDGMVCGVAVADETVRLDTS